MDEAEERSILERWFVQDFGKQVVGRQTEGMTRAATRMRLVADQRLASCRASDAARVFDTIAGQGTGLSHSEDEIAVLARCGWLSMNRAVVTVKRRSTREGAEVVEILVRAAALEGRISQHGARKLLNKLSSLLAPLLLTPLQAAPD